MRLLLLLDLRRYKNIENGISTPAATKAQAVWSTQSGNYENET